MERVRVVTVVQFSESDLMVTMQAAHVVVVVALQCSTPASTFYVSFSISRTGLMLEGGDWEDSTEGIAGNTNRLCTAAWAGILQLRSSVIGLFDDDNISVMLALYPALRHHHICSVCASGCVSRCLDFREVQASFDVTRLGRFIVIVVAVIVTLPHHPSSSHIDILLATVISILICQSIRLSSAADRWKARYCSDPHHQQYKDMCVFTIPVCLHHVLIMYRYERINTGKEYCMEYMSVDYTKDDKPDGCTTARCQSCMRGGSGNGSVTGQFAGAIPFC